LVQESEERRVAVVTGAARGIGAAIAGRLAEDGYAVALLDIDGHTAKSTSEELNARGHRTMAISADISDGDQVQSAIQAVAGELGPPLVVVNNAGVTRDNLLFRLTEAEWDQVMDVHLKGAFLTTKACAAHMKEAGWGRIVTISSQSALGNRGQANYSAAKAGLQGFTKAVAIELGRFGVTANSVAPGFVVTEMTAATAERIGMPFQDYQAAAAKRLAVKRVGNVQDIAHAVSFFVSDGAGFVSGQTLYVSGGPVG